MDIKVAKTIVAEAGENGIEMRLYEDYSGRGMYGEMTAGVVCETIGGLLAAVAYASYREGDARTGPEIADAMTGVKSDYLGKQVIIY